MNQKYVVKLSDSERERLKKMLKAGVAKARTLRRAQILLKSDTSAGGVGWTYEQIREAFDVSPVTVHKVRKAYVEQGLEAALKGRQSSREYITRLDGNAEARLIALACSAPPAGHERWTLRLLQDRLVRLEVVESVSHETVRQTLKKMHLSLG
jgi:transposase